MHNTSCLCATSALRMGISVVSIVACVVVIVFDIAEAGETCGTFSECPTYCCYHNYWTDRYCCDDCSKSYYDSTRHSLWCKSGLEAYQLALICLGLFIVVGIIVAIVAYFVCKNLYNTKRNQVTPTNSGTVMLVTTTGPVAQPPPPPQYATVVAQPNKTFEPPPPQPYSDAPATTTAPA